MKKGSGISFLLSSLAVSLVFLWIASERNLSSLENVLLQIFSLGLGLIGSYILGQVSAREGARDLMKPHARSAFRRLIALYRGLSRIDIVIREAALTLSREEYVSSPLERIAGMATEQIATAEDALADWEDIVPEEVQELRARLDEIKGTRNV